MKNLIIFASGICIGAAGMYFGLKKHFESRADAEIESVRKAYDERLSSLEPKKTSKDGDLNGPKEIDVKKKITELNNKPDLLDYTKYFKPSGVRLDGSTELIRDAKKDAIENGLSEEELAERELYQDDIDPSEMERPEDDEPYTDEEDREQSLEYEDYQLNGAHKKALEDGKPPFEIAPEDYDLTCKNYEKMDLLWYVYDETLANEAEEFVDEALFAGSVIEDSGFDTDDRNVLYVRNDRLMCDIAITKIYEHFERSK